MLDSKTNKPESSLLDIPSFFPFLLTSLPSMFKNPYSLIPYNTLVSELTACWAPVCVHIFLLIPVN